jgi:Tfp pilus assembly protein FimT
MVIFNRDYSPQGFTLFEVVVYVAIFSIVIYFIGGFGYNIYMGKDRIEALQDINANGRLMLDSMSQAVEQSTGVDVGEE